MSSLSLPKLGFNVFLLTSLIFQVILTLLGSFRKRCPKKWFTFLLWSTYQLADVAATTGLGILSGLADASDVPFFWSPFLLLHLGGPDCVTAISLVDNELCFRQLLQLIYRVGVAVHVYVKGVLFFLDPIEWPWSILLNVLLLLAGISKYGEKSWALHSANLASLRDSMLPTPNSGPRPIILSDDDGDDDGDDYNIRMVAAPAPAQAEKTLVENQLDSDEAILLQGYHYFCSFRCLFVDLTVPCSHIIDSQRSFLQYPCEVSFQLIDVELTFVYDMFFTKTPVVRTFLGCSLRFLRVSTLLSIFILSLQDGAVVLQFREFYFATWALVQEMYEVIQMLLSEWTVVWLKNHKLNRFSMIILKLILSCRLLISRVKFCKFGIGGAASEKTATTTITTWWCNNIMAQCNLLSFCFKDDATMFRRVHRFSWGKSIHEWIENNRNTTYLDVNNDIKDFIFEQFKERVQSFIDEEMQSVEFHNPRGKWAMKKNNCLEELGWSVDVGFDQSVLMWHVATDLCYYSDDLDSNECEIETLRQVEVSKALSNYLLYLQLILPFMVNNKIGKIRFQDTCGRIQMLFDMLEDGGQKFNNIFSFVFQKKKSAVIERRAQACIRRFLRLDSEALKAEESKSVLFDAHSLAKLLQGYAKEKRWKILSGVWVEMLSYAASHCSGRHHAQRLCEGGEFLTKIWLLMAHLGMME